MCVCHVHVHVCVCTYIHAISHIRMYIHPTQFMEICSSLNIEYNFLTEMKQRLHILMHIIEDDRFVKLLQIPDID